MDEWRGLKNSERAVKGEKGMGREEGGKLEVKGQDKREE